MKAVVTGATSFLGVAMIQKLLQKGLEVYAVVRPASVNLEKVPEGAHRIELELESLDRIDEYIKEPCEIFLHFGWDGSGSQNRLRSDVQRKNVVDSMKALEGAGKLGCKRFLFSGSQAEYGMSQTLMTEDMTCHPVSEYGKAKLAFYEQAHRRCQAWREAGQGGMELIHARIFSVYGPGDHPGSLVSSCLKTFAQGGHMALGDCSQLWNYLYLDDCIEGVLSLVFCEHALAEDGIYNIAGDPSATKPLREYVEEMYEACQKGGNFTCGLLEPHAEGRANLIPDIRKVQKATGWYPKITFKEGIKRMQKKCLICGQPLPEQSLMKLPGMPASAQDIPDEQQVISDHGITLQLVQCEACGLVQFCITPVAYYKDVIRAGGFSTTMVELRRSQYRHLINTYHLEGRKFLEVGCGRGEFLKILTEFPVTAYGVEHKTDLIRMAQAEGLTVFPGFTETADTVLGEHGPYDVFLSFNFLEHQPDPGKMLDCISHNLAEDGMGLITVPSLEYILNYDGYYELIRDHIAYYSFETLRYLLELHGFLVLEEELVNRDTCAVIVRKNPDVAKNAVKPQWQPVDLSGLQSGKEVLVRELQHLAEELLAQHRKLALWGAGHQGFTLAATTCIGEAAQYIVDSAPFKQGRFAPASHLPIVPPEYYEDHPVDVILIVAPGYTREIAETIRSRYGSRVKILMLRSDHLEEWKETV